MQEKGGCMGATGVDNTLAPHGGPFTERVDASERPGHRGLTRGPGPGPDRHRVHGPGLRLLRPPDRLHEVGRRRRGGQGHAPGQRLRLERPDPLRPLAGADRRARDHRGPDDPPHLPGPAPGHARRRGDLRLRQVVPGRPDLRHHRGGPPRCAADLRLPGPVPRRADHPGQPAAAVGAVQPVLLHAGPDAGLLRRERLEEGRRLPVPQRAPRRPRVAHEVGLVRLRRRRACWSAR